MAKPCRRKSGPSSRQVSIRFTTQEFDAIAEAAASARKTVSEWIRQKCLVRIVLPRV